MSTVACHCTGDAQRCLTRAPPGFESVQLAVALLVALQLMFLACAVRRDQAGPS